MGITTSIEGKEHDTRNIGSCPTILIFINVVQINSEMLFSNYAKNDELCIYMSNWILLV